MNYKMPLYILLFVAILGAGGFVYIRSQQVTPKTTTPVQNTAVTPPPKSISTPVPVQIRQSRGKVTAVSATSLAIQVGTAVENFTLSANVDVLKLVSGTLEGGNAKTEQAKLADIVVGKEVLVVADKTSPNVRSILILK